MHLLYLNFHGVGPVSREIDAEERDCWLDQDFFHAVLDLVRDQSHVRLTVDDGNASDHEFVLPALLQRGLRATFFICSSRLDRPTFLSQKQVRELRSHGMGVGSHGAAHVSWRHLPSTQLTDEIEGSRRDIEDACGIRVDSAACPLGAYDRRVLHRLRQAGYRFVYTSDGGISRETQWLRARTTVSRLTPFNDIRRLVRHGPGMGAQASINLRKLLKRLR